jgi:nucleotide-binding universal stress UspA family protein
MLNKIIIPLDGSDLAERALSPAIQLARRAEAPVILVRSIEPERIVVTDIYALGSYGAARPTHSVEQARKNAEAYLKRVSKQKVPEGLMVRSEVKEGDPAAMIVETAHAASAGLIVMSSHGYSGVTRWVQGSVAERVLHETPCPVLIVRSEKPIQHILIPLDGSPLSERVLPIATEVAKHLQCKVTFLRAIQPALSVDLESLEKIERGLGRSYQEEIHQGSQDYLQPFADKYRPHLPEVNTIVMHGPTAQGILDYAALHDVDLIAMSTHGRTGFQRWVYGSVTEKVLHAASNCSMLVVRPETHYLN